MLLVPGLALALGWPRTTVGAVAMTSAVLATAGLLIVGALYWRGVDRRLKGLGNSALDKALAVADRAELPAIAVTAIAIASTVVAVLIDGFSASSIASTVLTVLAVLEYLNYYRAQLQYFDNVADLKRLGTGKLKRAHMARDLAEFRRS